ncbi:dihydrolipoamide acetyltransferase family protein [Alteribacter natronophilus]|uniref:dihydrolipoamide acetyltransferase family protein n=1 Tax=Alteribacter natronophilus TaxID=2583810 RepID=UPI00110DD289|nr:dihydrolipoamide acetyltransferase family protein [Alteribacter natronophilus]TMW73075.1 2-oxo acid dehydrogenase subunit E2 [Alteribacter natronophilus]
MVEVKLHDVGEGMTEGEISQFLVNVGDSVSVDQPLVEVQTDKVSAELPSPVAGTVKEIKAEVGEVVSVGTTVIVLEKAGSTSGTEVKKSEPQAKAEKSGEQTTFKMRIDKNRSAPSTNRVLATPYTRRLALENSIDIEEVKGTGPAGRVTDDDVLAFRDSGGLSDQPAPYSSVEDKSREAVQTAEATLEESEMIPYRGRRKQIGKKMTHSLKTIPHVTHFDEVDLTNLIALREEIKEEEGSAPGAAAFFAKALAMALKDYPVFNAILHEDKEQIELKKTYNIGFAADTEEGLIVPVVHGTERLSISRLDSEIKRVMKMAKENSLTKKELTGGTFTVSNVGPLGSTGATPVINEPETALIAFHKTKKMPVVRNDEIVIRSMMNLSMSFDHRVADGATAVAFTNRFAGLIENPAKMMLEMV